MRYRITKICFWGYDVIYGGCSKDNYASYRVMQKVGMRNDAFYENGDPVFCIDKEAYHYEVKKVMEK